MATRTPFDFDNILKEAEARQVVSQEQVQQLKQVQKEHAMAQEIAVWEDDPGSSPKPIQVAVPNLEAKNFAIKIVEEKVPDPGIYEPGTAAFRYWSAAAALRRAADYWSELLPNMQWQLGQVLPVHLDDETILELNAYYDRQGIQFFHDIVNGATVYSGESPDVLCHELGHAVLDALRPDFWNMASDEIAAFHESFGDISSILTSLQLESVRKKVLAETHNRLYYASRVSRLAEQLGRAIRQVDPQGAEDDCLRNAINRFFYQDPTTLPPLAPATSLSSEPHSFSRIFTGAFFGALAGMLAVHTSSPNEADLLQISKEAGKLLIEALRHAPAVTDFYSQVAAHMLEADAMHFNRKYSNALTASFVRHGLLSLEAASTVSSRGVTSITAAMNGRPTATETRTITLSALNYGLSQKVLLVNAPVENRRLPATAASATPGAVTPPSGERAARAFVEDLFRRGKIDTENFAETSVGTARSTTGKKTTHKLISTNEGALMLHRTRFDCGL